MKKESTSNTFSDGLVMDFNPLVAPKNTMSNALNATLLTYNGNDNVLLNDMGNAKIPNAKLPEGFIPVGTTELGGIIYIASYNPITHEGQLGSFPSPQQGAIRLNKDDNKVSLNVSDLVTLKDNKFTNTEKIKSRQLLLYLSDDILHAGDLFRIYVDPINEYLSAFNTDTNPDKHPKYIKLSVVSVQDDGKIVNLNKYLRWTYKENTTGKYYYLNTFDNVQPPEYDPVNKLFNYSTYISKVSGRLAILVLLECIDSFSVSWDAKKDEDKWKIYLATNWTYNNEEDLSAINLNSIRYLIDENDPEVLPIAYPTLIGETIKYIAPDAYNEDQIYLSPDTESIKNKIARHNNYTDADFKITDPIFTQKEKEGKIKLSVWPCMPFGYINEFKQTFTINLEELGSGKIKLDQYKYLHDNKGLTLYWGISAYPERNKKINSVEFKLFQLTNKLYNDIIVTGAYQELNGDSSFSQCLTNDKYQLISSFIDKRISYSGYFSKRLTNLVDNQIYLVEMCIDYSGEKKYLYRILYNSDIFNNYFDYIDDYKEIDLNQILKQSITYKLSDIYFTNLEYTNKLYLNNIEVSTISKYIDDVSKLTSETYYTYNKETFDITGNVKANSIWNFINTSVNTIAVKDSIKYNNIVNTSLIQLAYGGLESNITTLETIKNTTELTNIKYDKLFTASYSTEINTPIIISYGTKIDVPVEYELTPLVVNTDYWIMVEGLHHIWSIGIYNDYNISQVSPQAKISYKDDVKRSGNILIYPDLYNFLDSQLDKADILALRFRTHDSAIDGGEKNLSIWAKGTLYTSSTTHGLYNLYYYSGQGKVDNGPNLIMYAIKDSNNTVLLFTYGNLSKTTWYDKNIKPYDEVSTQQGFEFKSDWPKGVAKPITLNLKDVTEDVLTAPFKHYKKLVSIIETVLKLRWDNVKYYSDFTCNTTCTLPVKALILLQMNNILIIPNLTNCLNLHYNSNLDTELNISFNTEITPSYYINQLSYTDTSKSLVKIPTDNGYKIKELEISPKSLYIDENTPIYYLKEDEGIADNSWVNQANTLYKITILNELLRVTLGAVNKNRYVMAIGREEELNATIKEIINLGPIQDGEHRE